MDKDLELMLSPNNRMSPEERERLMRMMEQMPPRPGLGGLLFPPREQSGSPRSPQGPTFEGSPRSPQGPQGPGAPREPWPSEEQWRAGTRDMIDAIRRLKKGLR
jgi:hypothetical protein